MEAHLLFRGDLGLLQIKYIKIGGCITPAFVKET
jgi:hypothetical protein